LDFIRLAALANLLEGINLALDGVLVLSGELIAILTQLLFHFVDQAIGMVEGLHLFLALLVLLSVLLGFLHALVDLLLRQVGGGGDGDLLLVAGGLILGR